MHEQLFVMNESRICNASRNGLSSVWGFHFRCVLGYGVSTVIAIVLTCCLVSLERTRSDLTLEVHNKSGLVMLNFGCGLGIDFGWVSDSFLVALWVYK